MTIHRTIILIAAAFLLIAARLPTAAEIVEVAPTVRTTDSAPASDTSSPVVTIFTPPSRTSTDSHAVRSDVILRMELPDSIQVNRPFFVRLRAYDALGLPIPKFDAPVTFECANGIIPVVSSRSWLNGMLEDTVIIVRAGKNSRLVAIAGDALAALHVDVVTPPPDKAMWLRLADDNIAAGKIDDALFCLKKASDFEPAGDPAIERRIGRMYMEREQWSEAEEHFRRAVRAITASGSR